MSESQVIRISHVSILLALGLLAMPFVVAVPEDHGGSEWALSDAVHRPNEGPILIGASCLVGTHPLCVWKFPDFGARVALHGNTAVVGEPNADAIHIYQDSTLGWIHAGSHSGPEGFGAAIAVDGGTIIAGAGRGSEARLFTLQEGSWTHTTTLSPNGSGCFGNSVDVRDGQIAVGDPCTSMVHVFKMIDGIPMDAAILDVPGVTKLGGLVAIAGESVVASASPDRRYVFEPVDNGWGSVLVATETRGSSLTADGDWFATADDDEVAVYGRIDGSWSRSATLSPVDSSPFQEYERFGASLSLRGHTLVVGAPLDDPFPDDENDLPEESDVCIAQFLPCTPPRPGAAYVFDWTGDEWRQTAKLSPETIGGNRVGQGVAMDPAESRILVGAPLKSRIWNQADLDPVDTVYVYERKGSS